MQFLGGELLQGDCLKIMKGIQDHSIGMILCDLPYGTTQNKWDSEIPLDELWKEYRRIIKPKGVIALTSQGLFIYENEVYKSPSAAGSKIQNGMPVNGWKFWKFSDDKTGKVHPIERLRKK